MKGPGRPERALLLCVIIVLRLVRTTTASAGSRSSPASAGDVAGRTRRRHGSWPRASIRQRPPRRWPGGTGCTPASSSSGGSSCSEARPLGGRDDRRARGRAGADGGRQRSSSRGRGPNGDRARPGGGTGRERCRCRRTAAGARGGARPDVIAVPPGVRILLAARPVDFRKGMDGLAALVQQALRADPFAGDVFIFRPKRADRVKILVFDGTGLVLYAKRL